MHGCLRRYSDMDPLRNYTERDLTKNYSFYFKSQLYTYIYIYRNLRKNNKL